MMYATEQHDLSNRIKAMPKSLADKAAQAIGGFASGFMSGYEAAKNELRAEPEAKRDEGTNDPA